MITLLIVEDNDFERESLKKCINWEMMGIQKILIASNGHEGSEIIIKHKPDIVMTDIRMPQMDGLEMMEKVKKHDSQAKFVICSAFEDFHYVKQAMQIGATNYLLKPINQKELIQTIRDICNNIIDEKLNEEEKKRYEENHTEFMRVMKTNFLRYLLLSSNSGRSHDIYLNMNDIYLNIHAMYRLCVVEIFLEDEKIIKKYDLNKRILTEINESELSRNVECFFDSEGLLVALIHSVKNEEESLSKLNQYCEKIIGIKNEISFRYFVGVSNTTTDITKLNMLFNECKYVLRKRIVLGYDKVEFFLETDWKQNLSAPKLVETDQLIQEVVSTTLTGKEYESLLTDLENTFKVHFSDSMESVQSNLIKLVSELYADDDKIMLKEDKNKSLSDIYKNIINARSIPGAIVCVRQVCESIRDNLAISSQNKTDKLVNDIKDIIQNEYMENITLNYLAKRVYLSANYIRIIFKENTGKSVLDQLIDVRIRKAKELLANTTDSVSEIAMKTGYPNSSYFHTVFKSQVGMTPAEYRKSRNS